MRSYFSLSNITTGFIAVMVGFTSSAAIVFQAALAAGASSHEISSWLFALGLSIALPCIGFSLYYRMPILVSWSTPGAALLATSLSGFSMGEAVGAFMVASLLTLIAGVTGLFEKLMKHIPRSLTSAMLAGILLQFGIHVFSAMEAQFSLVFSLLVTYLLCKRYCPQYTILAVLMIGMVISRVNGLFHIENLPFAFTSPIFTAPIFTWASVIGIGIPLFVVTMSSQNVPGLAIINAAGYHPPVSTVTSWIGFSNLIFAPFGCFSICLAALTAAICTSHETDIDVNHRYKSTLFAGFYWILISAFGAAIVSLFSAFPKELIASIAGLAIFSTIGSSMKVALEEMAHREAAVITLLVSASNISLFGIGAPFWGLIAGILASLLLNWRPQAETTIAATKNT